MLYFWFKILIYCVGRRQFVPGTIMRIFLASQVFFSLFYYSKEYSYTYQFRSIFLKICLLYFENISIIQTFINLIFKTFSWFNFPFLYQLVDQFYFQVSYRFMMQCCTASSVIHRDGKCQNLQVKKTCCPHYEVVISVYLIWMSDNN